MRLVCLVVLLSGCASANELCVQRGVFAGDEVDFNGKKAEVVSVEGESYLCRHESHPVMATVKYK